MAASRIRAKGQLTIPHDVRERAHLEEGDPVEFEVTAEGAILVRPQRMIDRSQAWFWTPEWQEGELEATEDIVAGRTTRYNSGEELLDAIRARRRTHADV